MLSISLISFFATQLYCNEFAQCGCSVAKCLADYLWQTIVPIIFFSFIWILFRFIEKQEEREQIRSEHTQMELKFLKNQINPDVLLNNLNTIYSYALERPDETPDLILKLADNLKHVLYESNTETVALEKELTFIDNYIAFQEIRTEHVKTIEYTKNITSSEYRIAPLLLITIIENAFKHSSMGSLISIVITVDNGKLSCECKNEYIAKEETNEAHIGLQNLKKRLQLLYPNKHALHIEKEKQYIVQLDLSLS